MLHRLIPRDPARLGEIRALVKGAVSGEVLPSGPTDEVVLAVSEACANVLRHTSSEVIDLRIEVLPDRVEVEVADSGLFRANVPGAGLGATSGRGMMLMLAMMDEVRIKEGTETRPGTVLHLVKYRSQGTGLG